MKTMDVDFGDLMIASPAALGSVLAAEATLLLMASPGLLGASLRRETL